MKILLSVLLFFSICAQAEHPRIYCNDDAKEEIKNKIRSHIWAKSNFDNIKASIDPYVKRHKTDPDWIVSRLQMYWNNKYADVYVNGAIFSHGEGISPVATPKFAGGRDWAVDYLAPSIEDIKPYMDDQRGMWLQNGKKQGNPWEWAPLDKTGQIIERINERIMLMAQNAAFVYWLTGDEDYAKFAMDIFWTYTHGMHHRGNPITYQDHRSKQIVGLATFEVIHEQITEYLSVCYDFLYDYLVDCGRDISIVEDVFRRWADRIIEGGSGNGNWNINQARYIVFLGLTLQDNNVYQDGKGLQYYTDTFLTASQPNQKAICDVINDEYDPDQAIWPEAPGYAFGMAPLIMKLARLVGNVTDEDIIEKYPIVERAYLAYFQYLFPNGYSVGFGDTYHDRPKAEPIEMLVSLYRKRDDLKNEIAITSALNELIDSGYNRSKNNTIFSLTTFVDKLRTTDIGIDSLQTPTYYSRAVNMFFQRNGDNPQTALAATLTGTAGGHAHANGMALELYGCGMIIAPDGGRGSSYWQKEHGEYYMRLPAHNTVIVDGVSNYNPNRSDRRSAFRIQSCEPSPESLERINSNISFLNASYLDISTDTDQLRTLAIIRTGENSGYYVDIFRSVRRDRNDKFHDYIFHTIGELSSVTVSKPNEIKFNSSSHLNSKNGVLVGYDYLKNEQSACSGGDVTAVFEVPVEKTPSLKMWSAGFDDTHIFTVDAPHSRAAIRGSVPKVICTNPLPTMIIRRKGEAWNKPFINIYEPYFRDKGSFIKNIRSLSVQDGIVAVEVLGAASKQIILSSTVDYERFSIGKVEFEGNFAVVSFTLDEKIEYIYLGSGRYISVDGYGIDAGENIVAAAINFNQDEITASADDSGRLLVPVKSKDSLVVIDDLQDKYSPSPRYIKDEDDIIASVRIKKCYNAKIKIR